MRLNVDVSEYGLQGKGTILVDRVTGRFIRQFNVGPASDGDGYNGQETWISDAGSAVYPQTNADTQARIMTWSKLLAQFGSSDVPAHTTMRVGQGREDVAFADVRRVDGGNVPFEIRDRDASGTRVIHVRRVEFLRSVPAGAFAPPVLARDSGLKHHSEVATVPILQERIGARTLPLLVVNARINGGPSMRFLIEPAARTSSRPRSRKNCTS